MFNDRDGVVAYFPVERSGIRKEEQIGIQVGDVTDGRFPVKDVQRQSRCAGKVILDGRSVLLSLKQSGALIFKLSQRYQSHIGQTHLLKSVVTTVIHA